jgi:hypothetical protein
LRGKGMRNRVRYMEDWTDHLEIGVQMRYVG